LAENKGATPRTNRLVPQNALQAEIVIADQYKRFLEIGYETDVHDGTFDRWNGSLSGLHRIVMVGNQVGDSYPSQYLHDDLILDGKNIYSSFVILGFRRLAAGEPSCQLGLESVEMVWKDFDIEEDVYLALLAPEILLENREVVVTRQDVFETCI
jgi:hypothetical protein